MPAVPPGTISLSCSTAQGTLTVTVAYDLDSDTFRTDAITAAGAGAGRLNINLTDGTAVHLPVAPNKVITAGDLAAAGVTNWTQVHSITLAAAGSP